MSNLSVSQNNSVKVQQQKKQPLKQAEAKQQSVSFFDEKWSGQQIAKYTGDNVITDWLQNKDKVCTDGKDDGKIGVKEGTKSFLKGLIGGIPKAIINHPVATLVAVGVGAAAVAATGGAILPVLGAIGVTAGVGMTGYGTYKAVTAKTDGEAKQALETMGLGVATTVLSANAADKMLDNAAKAGVKSAQVSKDASTISKTVQMFKATPEALKVSKDQGTAFIKGVTYESYMEEGGNVSRKFVSQAKKYARKAQKRIVADANEYGRELKPEEIEQIKDIGATRDKIIETIHAKAKELPNGATIEVEKQDGGFFSWDSYNANVKYKSLDIDKSRGYWGRHCHPRHDDDSPIKSLYDMHDAIDKFNVSKDLVKNTAQRLLNNPEFDGKYRRIRNLSEVKTEISSLFNQRAQIKSAAEYLGESPDKALSTNRSTFFDYLTENKRIAANNNKYLK